MVTCHFFKVQNQSTKSQLSATPLVYPLSSTILNPNNHQSFISKNTLFDNTVEAYDLGNCLFILE